MYNDVKYNGVEITFNINVVQFKYGEELKCIYVDHDGFEGAMIDINNMKLCVATEMNENFYETIVSEQIPGTYGCEFTPICKARIYLPKKGDTNAMSGL